MGANAYQYDVKLNLSAETKMAKTQIGELQRQLQEVSNLKLNFNGLNQLTDEINEASTAALKLQTNLQNALNPNTGILDFSKFDSSIRKSGDSIESLAQSLLKAGSSGSQSFVTLADSIARSEIPLMRTSKLVNGLWDNLKKTAGWQISSSVIHGVMGQYQQAMGYAKALDKSLNDIRIVTGQSADQMARFAKEANAAAKKLSTTTTDYTNASLIYYQQGLSDSEVKKRSDITIKMANATGTSASKVSDQLTSIWNNFDNGTKSLEHYADVMTALGAATASSTDEIAKGIQKFAAISDTVGLSYEYAASALATITATTRESADTVGNSLKTLFSRIQGLQLGEVLDDGTTLNKYSTALAKVGISIKDASGNLRDMNSILDDMGSKWHTLAEDQQMALAQTVGGVRQYTQIMTLMENWDFFQQNLTTANTSSGALTMQAEIYADSWEAAQKRMKASMEGVYDNLINSESFKDLLNIGASIVDGINKSLISGLGGGAGIFATVAGIFGNVFKNQLSSSLSNTFYTLQQMLPKQREEAEARRDKTLNSMLNSIRDPITTPGLGDYEREQAANITQRIFEEQKIVNKKRAKMSEENRALDIELEKSLLKLDERQLDIARRRDRGEAKIEAARESLDDSNYLRKAYSIPEEMSEIGMSQDTLNFAQAMLWDSSIGGDETKQINASLIKTFSTLGEREAIALSEVERMGTYLVNGKTKEDDLYDKSNVDAEVKGLFVDLLGISKNELGRINSVPDEELSQREQILKSQLNKRLESFDAEYEKWIQDIGTPTAAGSKTDFKEAFSKYFTKQIEGVEQDLKDGLGISFETADKMVAVDDIIEGSREKKTGELEDQYVTEIKSRIQQDREKIQNQAADSLANSAISGLTGFASTAGAMQNFRGAWESDNIVGKIAGVTGGLFNLGAGKKSYTDLFSSLGTAGKRFKESSEVQLNKKQMEEEYALLSRQKEDYDYYTSEKAAADAEINKYNVQNKRRHKKKNAEREAAKDAAQERQRDAIIGLDSLEAEGFDPSSAAGQLSKLGASLSKLSDVKVGKAPELLGKVGDGLTKMSAKADKFAGALQAAQIAMEITSKGLDYIYNTNQRNAQKAATTASELENAYSLNQRNHSSLLAGIEEYDAATKKLTDTNLKGAAKSAAIYDQNQAAFDLALKYNLETTRVGDTVKIDEKALEQAKEESIQNMQVSKYAMNAAKVKAKEAQNKREEERLERKTGVDERWIYGGLTAGAGALAAALMFIPGVNLGVAAAAGIAAGAALITGKGVDILTDAARENSAIDKAVALTRETGSTSWMDEENASQLSGLSKEELQKYRKDIESLAESQFAAEQAKREVQEANAKDILRNDDRTEDFKHANKLQEGLIQQQEDWYENQKKYGWWNSTSKSRIEDAKSIESALGLTGSVVWQDDKKNDRLTYTTSDGQTGEISYDTLSTQMAAKEGKANADAYVDTMMDAYESIKQATGDENAAAGMLSLLSGDNFESATIAEIEAAKGLLSGLSTDSYGDFGFYDQYGNQDWSKYGEFAKSLGLSFTEGDSQSLISAMNEYALASGYENYAELFNNLGAAQNYSSPIVSMLDDFRAEAGNEQINNWFNTEQGKAIYGAMDQATIKEFYKELSYISSTQGADAGLQYLEGLSGILQGVKAEDMGEAMRAMLALDWDDWDNLDTSIIDTMKEFGVTIDNDSQALKNFIAVTRATAKAIPNLEQSMTSLIQAAGSLKDVEIGNKISDAVLEALKAQGYDLSDETFSTFGGENVVIGDTEHILEGIRQEVASTYGTYNETRDKVNNALSGSDAEARLDEVGKLSKTDFLTGIQWDENDPNGNRNNLDAYLVARSVLGNEGVLALEESIASKNAAEKILNQYKTEDGKVTHKWDETIGGYVQLTPEQIQKEQEIYDRAKEEQATAQWAIDQSYESIKASMDAAGNSVEAKKIAEQYVSTFNSFDEAMDNAVTKEMIANGDLTKQDALMYYASQYPELIDNINAYNAAVLAGNTALAERLEKEIELGVAVQDSIKAYKNATGKDIGVEDLEAAKESLREKLSKETITRDGVTMTKDQLYSEAELTKLATESLIAGYAENTLKSKGDTWISQIENMKPDDTVGREAAAQLGKNMQQLLGLTEYDITDIGEATENNPIIKAIQDGVADLSKIIKGDTEEAAKLRLYLIKNSVQGQNLTQKLNLSEKGRAWFTSDDNDQSRAQKKAYNRMLDATTQGNEENFEDAALDYSSTGADWEEFSTAVAMGSGGARRALESGTSLFTVKNADGTTTTTKRNFYWDDNANGEGKGGYMVESGVNKETGLMEYTAYTETTHGTGDVTTAEEGQKIYTGGGGGGGGGGPQKVSVKSAQELMTRYKTTDEKMARAEMEKTAALQAKDLLYGEAKIRQLNRINGLLRKQQQLTADRIKEEMDYLKKDKAHLEEVLERYNKDLKDDEKIELEFNNEGIITNYKQTIGKWAEELADFYRDGELTAEEGEKAEKLQKRIQDLQTVIQDYEDSLNQLLESIAAYENSLYEMFSNQMEVLTYKVQYKLEMENDDLSYISFYADAIKDSMGQISDFVEFTGEKAKELYDQIEVYNQGVTDIIDFAKENPLQLWAAEGIEGMYTAEQIEALRQYRDGIISTYQKLAGLRKEVEEKVLKTFDYWNEKVEKGISSISRYTDMLSQFKDIVNITGREVLGLSDSFMATFEQQSIDQSMDNIKAAKTHYEALAKTYEDAQAKLAEAQAAGNEESIEHWQDVVNKTQEEMESAQDSMLTTLNHTLSMINEQFTNSLNEAIETFNEKLYEFNGLEGLIADYEQIREQQDLMVEDYEKIYNLSKLNRNLEKTLNDTKLIAGKQKLLEFQEKINEINKSNVELSRYELEYLQAEYELKLAEIELENARSAKDTVRLSKDNEGNWSYIYTQNEQAVDEAQQKYEDALFKMQQMSRDYTKEMNKAMMDITQQMNEEIAALAIQDFETPEAYEAEVRRIQEKYQAQLEFREQELNKSLQNNANLYEQDWANYSKSQGYKISEAEDWVDTFGETTLGTLLGSNAALSDYTSLIGNMSNLLAGDLASAAATYFTNADKALQTYGTSLKGFKNMLSTTTNSITTESKQATKEVTDMADKMVNAFTEIADKVRAWQVEF